MRKIIIDCDPGHDDALAITLAIANTHELEILGFTTVGGNHLLELVTANLLNLLSYLHQDYPVSAGYEQPMCRQVEPQPKAHGQTGMDGPVFEPHNLHTTGKHALDFLKETLQASQDKVTLVCLGPLTNIAILLKTYPHLNEKIEGITIMGGGVQRGNTVSKGEFNIYADPEAAKIVFNSGVKMTMSGIEICEKASILHTEVDAIENKGLVSKLVIDLLAFYTKLNRGKDLPFTPLFDVVPMMHLLHPEIFESEFHNVDVETHGELTRGMTVVELRSFYKHDRDNTEILTEVNREKFVSLFMEDIERLNQTL